MRDGNRMSVVFGAALAALVSAGFAWLAAEERPSAEADSAPARAEPAHASQETAPARAGGPVRVGVYDSRAVAIAYGNSKLHQRRIAEAAAEHEAAKASGDSGRAEVIQARMKDLQNLRHMQVFGDAPIPDILKDLEAALAAEARKGRLDLIVREADIAFRGPGVEVVDITDALAETFEPSERVRGWMRDVRKHPPIPLERFPIECGEGKEGGEDEGGGGKEETRSGDRAGAEKAAEGAALAWLRLIDEGSYAESWEAASAHFKAVVPRARWIAEVAALRAGCGALGERSRKSARYTRSLPEAPRGEYVVIQFAARFARKPGAIETVTPVREEDGTWRVDGYYIR